MPPPEPNWLTPEEARARFGDLLHGPTGTHQSFPEPTGGEWRPEFGMGMVLSGYRLHRPLRVPHVRAPYRPKGR